MTGERTGKSGNLTRKNASRMETGKRSTNKIGTGEIRSSRGKVFGSCFSIYEGDVHRLCPREHDGTEKGEEEEEFRRGTGGTRTFTSDFEGRAVSRFATEISRELNFAFSYFFHDFYHWDYAFPDTSMANPSPLLHNRVKRAATLSNLSGHLSELGSTSRP